MNNCAQRCVGKKDWNDGKHSFLKHILKIPKVWNYIFLQKMGAAKKLRLESPKGLMETRGLGLWALAATVLTANGATFAVGLWLTTPTSSPQPTVWNQSKTMTWSKWSFTHCAKTLASLKDQLTFVPFCSKSWLDGNFSFSLHTEISASVFSFLLSFLSDSLNLFISSCSACCLFACSYIIPALRLLLL